MADTITSSGKNEAVIPPASAHRAIVSQSQLDPAKNKPATVVVEDISGLVYSESTYDAITEPRFQRICNDPKEFPPIYGHWIAVRYASTAAGQLYGPTQCVLERKTQIIDNTVQDHTVQF